MKKLQNISILTFILFAIFSLAFSNIINAQEERKKEKKTRIKIVTEEDGKKTVIDTTFNTDDFDKEAFMKEHNIKIDEGSDNMKLTKEIHVTVEEDDDGNVKKIIKSDSNEETIIIKKHHESADEEELMIIMESELDDLDEKMKELDAEMIELDSEIKMKIKKIKADTDDGEQYIIIIKDDEGKSDKKMIFITEDGEKVIIKSDDLDDDHEFIYYTDDGEVIKKKDGKVIVKTVTVTVEDDDDDDDDDDDND